MFYAWLNEYKRRKDRSMLEEMPLRADYKERIKQLMGNDGSLSYAVDRVLAEGMGDEESDNVLKEYVSNDNMEYIGEMWEEDSGEMRYGREPNSYLEDIVMAKCPGVIEVRDEMREAAEGIFDALGWIYSRPDDCLEQLRNVSHALLQIAEKLQKMDYLQVDYSDIHF